MVIAGEASGDLHGAAVVAELHQIDPQIELFGVGGDRMRQAGVDLLFHVDELAYIGFVEVVRHYGFFRRVFSRLREQLQARQPDGGDSHRLSRVQFAFRQSCKKFGIPRFLLHRSPGMGLGAGPCPQDGRLHRSTRGIV
jgi:lipid-A-disaccharide synthase